MQEAYGGQYAQSYKPQGNNIILQPQKVSLKYLTELAKSASY